MWETNSVRLHSLQGLRYGNLEANVKDRIDAYQREHGRLQLPRLPTAPREARFDGKCSQPRLIASTNPGARA